MKYSYSRYMKSKWGESCIEPGRVQYFHITVFAKVRSELLESACH
jgi:hypothetical protein